MSAAVVNGTLRVNPFPAIYYAAIICSDFQHAIVQGLLQLYNLQFQLIY